MPWHAAQCASCLQSSNMGSYLLPYNMVRIIITLACLIFFILQSRKEVEKYFSNATSSSTEYLSDKEADIRLPRIVICLANNPFKSAKFPETLDEYNNLTYSQDEVIGFIGEGSNVTEIATLYYGKCFVLEIPFQKKTMTNTIPKDNRDRGDLIGFNTTKEIRLYFIDHGQELCIIYGVVYCDVQLTNIVMEDYYHDIKIRAKKTVREER